MFDFQVKQIMRSLPIAGAILLCAVSANGQQKSHYYVGSSDIAITFAAERSSHVSGNDLWLEGGAIELHKNIYRHLGFAASVTGGTTTSSTPQVAPFSFVTTVFGPTYTMSTKSERYSVFAEGLVGESNGFHSLFTIGSGPTGSGVGTTSSTNSFAVQAGGGVDVRLTHHFAIRVAQVDYVRTQFPNGSTDVQNVLKVAGGVVLRFR
ncbi:MAG: hypothetical protein ABI142_06060 [Bryocella sp.]